MDIIIFEDEGYKHLFPLTLSRPVFDLRCGITTLAEKIAAYFKGREISFTARPVFRHTTEDSQRKYSATPKNNTLFISGRVVMNEKFKTVLNELPDNTMLAQGDTVLVAKLTKEKIAAAHIQDGVVTFDASLPMQQTSNALCIEYPWHLVSHNAEYIEEDAKKYTLGKIPKDLPKTVSLLEEERIFIAPSAQIMPGVVLDAREGAIVIDEEAEILPNAVLTGPIYVGKHSKIKAGAKIYEGTTIGDVCKVGGEVEESIIHGYSNKQHEGFLGHAYLGMWCNLGADTNNSDLKNSYGDVQVYINGKKTDTKEMFVGLFMGDHSKSGINTMFNTGTVIGFCSNVFGSGYLPKYVPSFTWLDAEKGATAYDMKKAKEVAGRVMARRKMEFSESDNEIFDYIYSLTEKERNYDKKSY